MLNLVLRPSLPFLSLAFKSLTVRSLSDRVRGVWMLSVSWKLFVSCVDMFDTCIMVQRKSELRL